ncbi:putative disease resistance protein RGA3 [Chenopodium quinoa]|uniref:putative disease resistance protein RGA3 n=1 Tax=Chenopodium quinoa TaxID=63459 RepID=UPI000B776C06|nr:putative disease resistance protein RGA3 [Chenopodium quinoa]
MGSLRIDFSMWRSNAVVEAQRVTLKDNRQLECLELYFGSMEEAEVTPTLGEMDKMLMCLQLPPNLKKFEILSYKGVEMPRRWLDGLSSLVSIRIYGCYNIRVLPHLSQLPHLKNLFLIGLRALEYLEDEDILVDGGGGGGKGGSGTRNVYFPSLEVLQLEDLCEVKGWTGPSKDYDDIGEPWKLLFPRLLQLKVYECFKLMSLPLAPKLESLSALEINWEVFELNLTSIDEEAPSSSSSTLFNSLKELYISLIDDGPASLTISSRLSDLQKLSINNFKKLQSLILESLSSVRHLTIISCKSLKNISVGNLSVLEILEISGGKDPEEELPQGIAWLTTLQKLEIRFFDNLTQLPEEMGNLSLLHELKISNCPKLASLPQSLLDLTSLQILDICNCPDLIKRYKKLNGPDCHLLQHIPKVHFFLWTDSDFNN